jgi:hypothetical protein
MRNSQDKVTRFEAELVDAADVEGARRSRSARQQLAHWVRLGRAVSNASVAHRPRIEAAPSGQLPTRELTDEEGNLTEYRPDGSSAPFPASR